MPLRLGDLAAPSATVFSRDASAKGSFLLSAVLITSQSRAAGQGTEACPLVHTWYSTARPPTLG